MPDKNHVVSTIVLMAQHPRDIDPKELHDHLLLSASAVGEMRRYEALLAEPDVNIALAMLAEQESHPDAVKPFFPAIRDAVEVTLTERMWRAGRERERNRTNEIDVVRFSEVMAEVPSARAERARHDRFLQDPGRHLPGAIPCLNPAGSIVIDGFVHLDGRLVPWTFEPCGVGPTAVAAAVGFMETHPDESLILVVGSHLRDGATLPANVTFVEVK